MSNLKNIGFNALSQMSLYPGLFTNWPGILWMGFVSEINWPEMKSIAANDKGELNRLCSTISNVSLFLEINITQIEASVTLFASVVLISQLLVNYMFLSKWIRACNFVQVGVLKKHWLLKFHLD